MRVEAYFDLRDQISRKLETVATAAENAERHVGELDRQVDTLARSDSPERFAAKMRLSMGVSSSSVSELRREVEGLIVMMRVLGSTDAHPNVSPRYGHGVTGALAPGGGGGGRGPIGTYAGTGGIGFFGRGLIGRALPFVLPFAPGLVQGAGGLLAAGGGALGALAPAGGAALAAYGGLAGLYGAGAAGAPAIAGPVSQALQLQQQLNQPGLSRQERRQAVRQYGRDPLTGDPLPPQALEAGQNVIGLVRAYKAIFETGERGQRQFALLNHSIQWAAVKGLPLLTKVWDQFFPVIDRNLRDLEKFLGSREGRGMVERWSKALAPVADDLLDIAGNAAKLAGNIAVGFAPFEHWMSQGIARWLGEKADWAASREGMAKMNDLAEASKPIWEGAAHAVGAFGTGLVDMTTGAGGRQAADLLERWADSTIPSFFEYIDRAARSGALEQIADDLGTIAHVAGELFGPGAAMNLGLNVLSDFLGIVRDLTDLLGPFASALVGVGSSLYIINRLGGVAMGLGGAGVLGSLLGGRGGRGAAGAAGLAGAGALAAGGMGGGGVGVVPVGVGAGAGRGILGNLRAGWGAFRSGQVPGPWTGSMRIPGNGGVILPPGVAAPMPSATLTQTSTAVSRAEALRIGLGLPTGASRAMLGRALLARGAGLAGLGFVGYEGIRAFTQGTPQPYQTPGQYLREPPRGNYAGVGTGIGAAAGAGIGAAAGLLSAGTLSGVGALVGSGIGGTVGGAIGGAIPGGVKPPAEDTLGQAREAIRAMNDQLRQQAPTVRDLVREYRQMERAIDRSKSGTREHNRQLRHQRDTLEQIAQADPLAVRRGAFGQPTGLRGGAAYATQPGLAGIAGPSGRAGVGDVLRATARTRTDLGRAYANAARIQKLVYRVAPDLVPALRAAIGTGDLEAVDNIELLAREQAKATGVPEAEVEHGFDVYRKQIQQTHGMVGTLITRLEDLRSEWPRVSRQAKEAARDLSRSELRAIQHPSTPHRVEVAAQAIPGGLRGGISEMVMSETPQIRRQGRNIARDYVDTVVKNLDLSGDKRRQAVRSLYLALGLDADGSLPERTRRDSRRAGREGAESVNRGVRDKRGDAKDTGAEFVTTLLRPFYQALPDFLGLGKAHGDSYNKGVKSQAPGAKSAGQTIFGAAMSVIGAGVSAVTGIGGDSGGGGGTPREPRGGSRGRGTRHGRVGGRADLLPGFAEGGRGSSGGGPGMGQVRFVGTPNEVKFFEAGVETGRKIRAEAMKKAGGRAGVGAVSSKGGTSMFDGHPVANWIIPELRWARAHGWGGSVASGWRSRQEQAVLYARYLAGGPLAAAPGSSMHEQTKYPGGAVDVSDYTTLAGMIGRYPGRYKLKWFGPGDPVHFSGTGHRAGGHAYAGGGRRVMGPNPNRDSVDARLAPHEFVVTPDGEHVLEQMTGMPGVLNWLQGVQRPAFREGGYAEVPRAATAVVGHANRPRGGGRGGGREFHFHFHGDVSAGGKHNVEEIADKLAARLEPVLRNLPEGADEMTFAG
jgi:hypothetical protein